MMAPEEDRPPATDSFSRLRELLELRDQGAISAKAFKARKKKILTQLWDEAARNVG